MGAGLGFVRIQRAAPSSPAHVSWTVRVQWGARRTLHVASSGTNAWMEARACRIEPSGSVVAMVMCIAKRPSKRG